MKNSLFIIAISAILITSIIGTSYAQKFSETFKEQQAIEDHPCLITGDPNMNSLVVQLRSDESEEETSTDECLLYIDTLIEQYGYKVHSVIPWGDNEYTWTLN